ncbi:winged helix-turn-helix domain-containing protein, partial [Azospirillum rugosum]
GRSQALDRDGFAFGAFVLVPRRHLLLHDGVPVTIGSRAFAILHELVRRAGDLVSKDDLLTLAWPSTFVDEANLRVQIASIRRVLGAHGDATGFIVNVSGRGYKFVETVA